MIELNVTPMGKPRMTQRDKWVKRPATTKYWKFCDELRAEAKRKGYRLTSKMPPIDFIVPMPKSWSKTKKFAMLGHPHKQKFDLDNGIKAMVDCLAKDVDFDDCEIYEFGRVRKFWGEFGLIRIYC